MLQQDHQRLTWFGQPVEMTAGRLAVLQGKLPTFERRPFGPQGSENEFLHAIVRLPIGVDDRSIPVATVSPQYDLVQHEEVLGWLTAGLKANREKPEELDGTLMLSKYGERMRISIQLPRYDFDPGDGHPLTLQACALNSVDKSTALEIHLGWWRQVCSNGLKVKVKGSTALRIHILGRKTSSEVGTMLKDQLSDADADRKRYTRWLGTPVDPCHVERWADADVARVWGPHAAARVCHIARTGQDGRIEDPFRKARPHELFVISERPVPGALAPVRNAYHVSQILSWLASHRATIQDQQERTAQIDLLMLALLREKARNE